MQVKCPECRVKYDIPPETIGDQPLKMRCNSCGFVFAVTRRTSIVPGGYEEFTGKQELPEEFAFLRRSGKERPSPLPPPASAVASSAPPPPPGSAARHSRPPQGPDRSTPKQMFAADPTSVPPPARTSRPTPTHPVDVPSNEQTAEWDPAAISVDIDTPSQAPPPTPAPESVQTPPPAPTAPTTQPQVAQPTASPAGVPAPVEPAAAAPPYQSGAQSMADIYGVSTPQGQTGGVPTSDWQAQAPMGMGDYLATDQTAKRQRTGKIVAAGVALFITFMVFVAWRNAWSISLPDLSGQIAFAFSGQAKETLPEEVEGLETMVKDRRVLVGGSAGSLLVVEGDIFNNTPGERNHIVLRGRIIDDKGDIRAESKAPCGIRLDDVEIKTADKSALKAKYRVAGRPFNCTVAGEGNGAFQIIFDTIPIDYAPSFKVDVLAVSARYPKIR